MKKLALVAAMTAAFASQSAFAFTTKDIQFDADGTGGVFGEQTVTTFDWAPGNVVSIDAIGVPGGAGATVFNSKGQGSLSALVQNLSGGGQLFTALPAGTEITYVFDIWETATGIGGTTASFSLAAGFTSTFSIYFQNPSDANDITGAGYNNGTKILEGTITSLSGNFTDYTLFQQSTVGYTPAFPGAPTYVKGLCLAEPGNFVNPTKCDPQLLDQLGADNQGGVLTHVGEGNQSLDIDVTFQNFDFFKTNITTLSLDAQTTTGVKVPFTQVNPSSVVNGYGPIEYGLEGGKIMNAAFCDANPANNPDGKCDIQFQTDASTTFTHEAVPEPETLALLGLGLLGLGFLRRRAA